MNSSRSHPRFQRGCRRLVAILGAWFLATGAQWDLLQVIAWGGMFAQNLASMPTVSALRRTFSPEGRCRLCRVVSSAKRDIADNATPDTKAPGKFVVFASEEIELPSPRIHPWTPEDRDFYPPDHARSRPPVPPPRG